MLIGHSQPKNVTWTINGNNAAILTPAALLTDDRPDTMTRFRWSNEGVQNTTRYIGIRGDWVGAITPGIVGFSNIRLPAGIRVVAHFRRPSDPAGTYPYLPMGSEQRIMEDARGARTVWMLPVSVPVIGVEFRVYNDANGSSPIVASHEFEIGEAVVRPVFDICVASKPTIDNIDPSVGIYSGSGMPYLSPGTGYRQLNFRFPVKGQGDYFGGEIAQVMARIDRGQSCVYVLRHKNPDGTFSPQLLHETAMIGTATKLPNFQHEAGPFFSSGAVVVREAPVPV